MSNYEYILFDLDGTISDPGIGITNSVMYALDKFGIHVSDRSELYKFIGPPLADSFMEYYGFNKEDAWKAVEFYREYFSEKGLYENIIYDEITELLIELKNRRKIIILATTKPEGFARNILDYFQITDYFTIIAGSAMNGERVKKAEVIQYALEQCEANTHSEIHKNKVLMIGDREHDVNGAKEVGVDCIGVLYGYGDRKELESAGANFIVESIIGIKDIVLGSVQTAPNKGMQI